MSLFSTVATRFSRQPLSRHGSRHRSLSDLTFTVVDLETTGTSIARGAKIIEIGAVKVRGGQVLEEFQMLVDPREQIAPFITNLTGISTPMVAGAPTIDVVLPAFTKFAVGSVLVAHNAPFDIGFLRHFTTQQNSRWPDFEVVDTLALARRMLDGREVPDYRLATLARLFAAPISPNHRALADARATVTVLHGLIARLAPHAQTLSDLQ